MKNIDGTEYTRFEIRGLDVLKDENGLWYWNDSWVIEDDVLISNDLYGLSLSRKICSYLRENEYLTEYSKGKVKVVDVDKDGTLIEIQNKKTEEPLFAFSIIEE